jgi:hypothetical protein
MKKKDSALQDCFLRAGVESRGRNGISQNGSCPVLIQPGSLYQVGQQDLFETPTNICFHEINMILRTT